MKCNIVFYSIRSAQLVMAISQILAGILQERHATFVSGHRAVLVQVGA